MLAGEGSTPDAAELEFRLVQQLVVPMKLVVKAEVLMD
jgi:hypothetical protein